MLIHDNALLYVLSYGYYYEISLLSLMFTSISDTAFYDLINDLNKSSMDILLCSQVNRSKFLVIDVSKNL